MMMTFSSRDIGRKKADSHPAEQVGLGMRTFLAIAPASLHIQRDSGQIHFSTLDQSAPRQLISRF
jgi:hypothetical protein